MITKKQFAVQINMKNDTENPSSIRFGGIDEAKIKDDHHLKYINTVGDSEWKIPLY